MSEPFVGEIRMFAGNFAPRGWSFCDGQLLAVSQNDALFSLLGTIYGGDGRTTFGLPDLRGRVPLHTGQGPGLSNRPLGQKGGAENVTLNTSELPQHRHTLRGYDAQPNTEKPGNHSISQINFGGTKGFEPAPAAGEHMNSNALSHVGGSRSHTNLMETLCLNFIIALFGIYPSRQ